MNDSPASFGGEPHHFEITVRMWGDGANWDSTLLPQSVRAWNLRDALVQASELPLSAWFPDEGPENTAL